MNEQIFLDYIADLSAAMNGEAFCLYLDQLNIHKMITVRESCEAHNIYLILNAAAMPDLNAIETCFCQVKLKYKQQRLHALVNEIEFDVEDAINKALEVITPELVKACVKRSIYLLHNH